MHDTEKPPQSLVFTETAEHKPSLRSMLLCDNLLRCWKIRTTAVVFLGGFSSRLYFNKGGNSVSELAKNSQAQKGRWDTLMKTHFVFCWRCKLDVVILKCMRHFMPQASRLALVLSWFWTNSLSKNWKFSGVNDFWFFLKEKQQIQCSRASYMKDL